MKKDMKTKKLKKKIKHPEKTKEMLITSKYRNFNYTRYIE